MDDLRKLGAEPDEIHARELAFEDGILEMIAEAAEDLENFAQAPVVADVVRDKIRISHVVCDQQTILGGRRFRRQPPIQQQSFDRRESTDCQSEFTTNEVMILELTEHTA